MDNFQLGEIRGLERARNLIQKKLERRFLGDNQLLDIFMELNAEINKIKNSNNYKQMFDEPRKLNSFGR